MISDKRKKAYTILELIVYIGLVMLIVTMSIPKYRGDIYRYEKFCRDYKDDLTYVLMKSQDYRRDISIENCRDHYKVVENGEVTSVKNAPENCHILSYRNVMRPRGKTRLKRYVDGTSIYIHNEKSKRTKRITVTPGVGRIKTENISLEDTDENSKMKYRDIIEGMMDYGN